MSNYEELLTRLDERLKKNKIKKREVMAYYYIYAMKPEELEKLLSLDWDNKIILGYLIKSFSSDEKYQDEKIELLEKLSRDTDIKYDKPKIEAAGMLINNISLFRKDTYILELIIGMIERSKTNLGATESARITRELLEYLNENLEGEPLREKDITVRLAEIVGFITRMEDEYKVRAASSIAYYYPNEKIGTMCGLIALLNNAENEKQASMIIDIAANKDIYKAGLELEAANKAVKSDDESLEEIAEILSYADIVTKDDIRADIASVKTKEEKLEAKQRTRNITK